LAALAMAGCHSLSGPAPTREYPMARVTGPMPDFLDDMDVSSLALAADRSLEYLAKVDPAAQFSFGARKASAMEMAASIRRLVEIFRAEPDAARRSKAIRREFDVYIGSGETTGGNVLITGYYQPELNVSGTKTARFRYPIYKSPDDLVRVDLGLFSQKYRGERIAGKVKEGRLVPYDDRRAIDGAGTLSGKGLEIAWAEDPFDVFMLHVQGSGILRFDDGSQIFANYDSANGREYHSIGKLLIDEGRTAREKMSVPALRQWFTMNPNELDRALFANPSYVFFRPMDDGPFGALGTKLVAGRSAAFDHSLFPKAAIAWFAADVPLAQGGQPAGARKTGGFVFNHDQGGAIKGAGRMDLFFGAGPDAEAAAGIMKNPGELYFLILKAR
jgi:membrane-bound lytic murein transglycosylase A